MTVSRFKDLARREVIPESEWHHTGKYFARTKFYNLAELAEDYDLAELDREDAEEAEEIEARGRCSHPADYRRNHSTGLYTLCGMCGGGQSEINE